MSDSENQTLSHPVPVLPVEDAKEELLDSIEQVTHQITMPGEIEAIHFRVDALISAVSAPLLAEIERLKKVLADHLIQCPQCHEEVRKIGGV